MNRSFQVACSKLVRNKITFSAFVAATSQVWQNYAKSLLRRWVAPSVDLQDVLQDLYLAAFQFAKTYDPSRGVEPWRYLTYNAADKAKKQLHKMRGAHRGINGNRDGSKARAAIPFSETTQQKESKIVATPSIWQKDQEENEVLAEKKIFIEGVISACTRQAERLTLQTFLDTGSAEETAVKLYANPDTRLECRFMSDTHAKKKVWATLKKIASRVDRAA